MRAILMQAHFYSGSLPDIITKDTLFVKFCSAVLFQRETNITLQGGTISQLPARNLALYTLS